MSVPVFFSYSHKDERYKDALETHLSVLRKNGYIDTWTDRKITAGKDWEQDINTHLEKAKIILLLISENFLASEYCYDTETIFALDQHEKKQAIVIPVILKPCLFSRSRLKHLQALPKDGKAITKWRNRNEAWVNVAEGIIHAIESNPTVINAVDFTSIVFGPGKKSEPATQGPETASELLLRFLRSYAKWYFSPVRIQKWGGRQKGFEKLKNEELTTIRNGLKELVSSGKVKTLKTKFGNALYKVA